MSFKTEVGDSGESHKTFKSEFHICELLNRSSLSFVSLIRHLKVSFIYVSFKTEVGDSVSLIKQIKMSFICVSF